MHSGQDIFLLNLYATISGKSDLGRNTSLMLVRRENLGNSIVTLVTSTGRHNITACCLATSLPNIAGSNNSQRGDLTGKHFSLTLWLLFLGSPSSVVWYAIHFFQFGLEKAAHQLFLEYVLRSELLQGNLSVMSFVTCS